MRSHLSRIYETSAALLGAACLALLLAATSLPNVARAGEYRAQQARHVVAVTPPAGWSSGDLKVREDGFSVFWTQSGGDGFMMLIFVDRGAPSKAVHDAAQTRWREEFTTMVMGRGQVSIDVAAHAEFPLKDADGAAWTGRRDWLTATWGDDAYVYSAQPGAPAPLWIATALGFGFPVDGVEKDFTALLRTLKVTKLD